MGLCSDLKDVSSDSVPLLLVAMAAHCVCYLRSWLFCILQSMGLSKIDGGDVVIASSADGQALWSGLAGMIALAQQLNTKHRAFGFGDGDGSNPDCVVCLCGLKEGEQVRRLDCSHVFHRECLDGWFDHSNLSCPLCRAPLVPEEHVAGVERRMGRDLLTWFSPTW